MIKSPRRLLLRGIDVVTWHLRADSNAASFCGNVFYIQSGKLDTVGDKILSRIVNINLAFVFELTEISWAVDLSRFLLGRIWWSIRPIFIRRA
jgi:hypothetical protein